MRHTARREGNCDKAYNVFHKDVDIEAVACVHNLQYSSVQLKMYEINTVLLLPLKIYLIVLKHIKSLILLKKVFISNFNVFILMFVICFLF